VRRLTRQRAALLARDSVPDIKRPVQAVGLYVTVQITPASRIETYMEKSRSCARTHERDQPESPVSRQLWGGGEELPARPETPRIQTGRVCPAGHVDLYGSARGPACVGFTLVCANVCEGVAADRIPP